MEECWDGICWEYDKGLRKNNRELLILLGEKKNQDRKYNLPLHWWWSDRAFILASSGPWRECSLKILSAQPQMGHSHHPLQLWGIVEDGKQIDCVAEDEERCWETLIWIGHGRYHHEDTAAVDSYTRPVHVPSNTPSWTRGAHETPSLSKDLLGAGGYHGHFLQSDEDAEPLLGTIRLNTQRGWDYKENQLNWNTIIKKIRNMHCTSKMWVAYFSQGPNTTSFKHQRMLPENVATV